MPFRASKATTETPHDHRTVNVRDESGGDHVLPVEVRPALKPARSVSLAALEQLGGPEHDFEIELPKREMLVLRVNFDA